MEVINLRSDFRGSFRLNMSYNAGDLADICTHFPTPVLAVIMGGLSSLFPHFADEHAADLLDVGVR